jgi:aspartyl aminopeptidase
MDITTAALNDLITFLDDSPSPHHVVASAVNRLRNAGFTEFAPTSPVGSTRPESNQKNYIVREGALIAWVLPDSHASGAPDMSHSSSGIRILGAHTDSPGLRVKAHPDHTSLNWKQLNVEVYGGILNNSWLDRDLGIAGIVTDADGNTHLLAVHEPIARIPQLAVHLDRAVNESGLVLDRQQHLRPVWALDTASGGHHNFAAWLGERLGGAQPIWWELGLFDIQKAAVLGADASMLVSGRLDNQLSCWAGVQALITCIPTDQPAMIVLNDHEEVGSASTTGAAGPLLEHTIEQITLSQGGGRSEFIARLGASMCISADNAHAVHPNYPDRHDPHHRPLVGAGPAIKINVNQRYATTAGTAHSFMRACEEAGVPWQVFTSHNSMPCGSTIGPITATRLGIDTVDVGVPQLSMHSARELCGVNDPVWLSQAVTHWMSGPS